MASEMQARIHRRERWVDLIVIVLLIVALGLGWAVKAWAEGRTMAYDDGTIRLAYPEGWIRSQAEPPVVLRVEDKWVQPFRTTLTLEQRPLPLDVPNPLAIIQQDLLLERGRNWTAFRLLSAEEEVTIGGHTGLRMVFVYVEANPNPFMETLPVVMRGEDFVLLADRAYVFTLTAAEVNYDRARPCLESLVHSFQR